MGMSPYGGSGQDVSSPDVMEDHLLLLDSVHALLSSIEDFRMSEVLQESNKDAVLWSLSGTGSVIHNAQHLVAAIELWQQRADGPDNETIEELIEMTFNALHRWLSWKSFAQLPKRNAHSSASSLKRAGAISPTSAEDALEDLFHGDPWEDCDELAAEDLLEWLADAMQYPPTAGVQNPYDAYAASAMKALSDHGKLDLACFVETSTCASLNSRQVMSASQLSSSSHCSSEFGFLELESTTSGDLRSNTDLESHHCPHSQDRDRHIGSKMLVRAPAITMTHLARQKKLVDVASAELTPREGWTPREVWASLHEGCQVVAGSSAVGLCSPSCNCLTCLLGISSHGEGS